MRAVFGQACKFYHRAIFDKSPGLNEYKAALVKKLVQHVVYGQQDEAEAMLKVYPGLLLLRATVVDYSGRIIENASAFECALGADDLDMVKMIEPYFDKLAYTNGEQEKAAQYRKQFPAGLEADPLYDFSALADVIAKSSEDDILAELKHEDRDSDLNAALKSFRANFARRTITTGYHFNYGNIIRALGVYGFKIIRAGLSSNHRDLYWRQVFGYVETFLSAYDAQTLCCGLLYRFFTGVNSVVRTLEHKRGHLYPLPANGEHVGVGFDGALLNGSFFHTSFNLRNLSEGAEVSVFSSHEEYKRKRMNLIHRRLAAIVPIESLTSDRLRQ